jgi:hypothetical protein
LIISAGAGGFDPSGYPTQRSCRIPQDPGAQFAALRNSLRW